MEGKLAAAARGRGFGEEEQDGKELLTNTNMLLLDRFLGLGAGGGGGGSPYVPGASRDVSAGLKDSTRHANCAARLFLYLKKEISFTFRPPRSWIFVVLQHLLQLFPSDHHLYMYICPLYMYICHLYMCMCHLYMYISPIHI